MSGWSSSVLSDKEGISIVYSIHACVTTLYLVAVCLMFIIHSPIYTYVRTCVPAYIARLMRNRSLTKEEVAAFWRQHGSIPNAGSPRAVPVQYCCTRNDDDGFFLPENAVDSSAAANGGSWYRTVPYVFTTS